MNKNYVTRTVEGVKVTALCLDIESAEPTNEVVILNGKFKREAAIEKAAKTAIETDTMKMVHIIGTEPISFLAVMEESEFLKFSKHYANREEFAKAQKEE